LSFFFADEKNMSVGTVGVGNSRKVPAGCTEALADKFNLNQNQTLETGQIANVASFVRPIGDVNASPLTFKMDSVADTFLQMDTMHFWIKCKIVKRDGEAPADTDKWGITNAFGLSFFRSINVLLNGYEISTGTESENGYKSYIETVLSYDMTSDRHNHLKSSIFEMDDMDHLECLDPATVAATAFKKRYDMANKGKSFDIVVPVTIDLCRASAHLAPHNKLTLVASRESDQFLIKSAKGNDLGLKVKVEDIKLMFNRIRLDPALTSRVMGKPANYYFAQTHLKRYPLPSNITSYNVELYNGALPRTIVIAQVATTSSQGSYKHNGFNFQHFDLNRLTLRINGLAVPCDSWTPNYGESIYGREYHDMLMATGHWRRDKSCSISKGRYSKGSCLFAADLSYDMCNNEHRHATSDGSMEIEISWGTALPKPITLLVYSVFNARLTVENTTQPAIVEII